MCKDNKGFIFDGSSTQCLLLFPSRKSARSCISLKGYSYLRSILPKLEFSEDELLLWENAVAIGTSGINDAQKATRKALAMADARWVWTVPLLLKVTEEIQWSKQERNCLWVVISNEKRKLQTFDDLRCVNINGGSLFRNFYSYSVYEDILWSYGNNGVFKNLQIQYIISMYIGRPVAVSVEECSLELAQVIGWRDFST